MKSIGSLQGHLRDKCHEEIHDVQILLASINLAAFLTVIGAFIPLDHIS